jgi:2-amino-4-hydroxy-6-hydroxymethyldihydropteridine diphosphokinase
MREALCRQVAERFSAAWFAEPAFPSPMPLRGNAPVVRRRSSAERDPVAEAKGAPPAAPLEPVSGGPAIEPGDAERWLSAYVPPLPPGGSPPAAAPGTPRLIARLQWTDEASGWPAPHQMWPRSGHWPEYRLEINDLEWAVNELGSAFASMRCPVRPVTDDGNWFST